MWSALLLPLKNIYYFIMLLFQIPILRSSQPLTGSSGRRCKDDEKLLSLVATRCKGTIVDTRSSSALSSNKTKRGLLIFFFNTNIFNFFGFLQFMFLKIVFCPIGVFSTDSWIYILMFYLNLIIFSFIKGGGIETDYYTHWRKTMHNIEKMAHLSETIARLREACFDHKSQNWLIKLEGSGWMRYIESCMTAAYKTALFVSKDSEPFSRLIINFVCISYIVKFMIQNDPKFSLSLPNKLKFDTLVSHFVKYQTLRFCFPYSTIYLFVSSFHDCH